MPGKLKNTSINRQRRAGVLLHPTSLPGPLLNGDIGHEAYRFIEFLQQQGIKVWQMLPLGPTHNDKSPYQCLSAHAGNPLLISLDWLEDKGWLQKDAVTLSETKSDYRKHCLRVAAANFYQMHDDYWQSRMREFTEQHESWLDDYALFMAFKHEFDDAPWYEWPDNVRHREHGRLGQARNELEAIIKQTVFEQFVFFVQWHEVRDYANRHNVELFGDMPIFVARDSAEVWAHRENFLIDADGDMEFIAGVPPDAFSDTGQRWGNPLYDWDLMKTNGFNWWKERFKTQLELFDMVRIDHFRGLQACWKIPKQDETAINGNWQEVPGAELLSELFKTFHHLPLIAEDLGVITDDVIVLKNSFNLPGMKVLQFGFDANPENPHLPHRHEHNDVVYTGTHDNDTTLGWAKDEANYNKRYLEDYTGQELSSLERVVWSMIRLALSSVSFLSMVPMQDLLMLDSDARMNKPGTTVGNWQWRFEWDQVNQTVIDEFSRLLGLFER
jgi:4-alpha-glucanotransferase